MRPKRRAQALAPAPVDLHYEQFARLFKLLGDPTRLKVLTTLLAGECSVGDIARATGLPAPTVSRALAPLFRHDLVTRRRADGAVHYRLVTPRLKRLVDTAGLVLGDTRKPTPTTAATRRAFVPNRPQSGAPTRRG